MVVAMVIAVIVTAMVIATVVATVVVATSVVVAVGHRFAVVGRVAAGRVDWFALHFAESLLGRSKLIGSCWSVLIGSYDSKKITDGTCLFLTIFELLFAEGELWVG